MIYKIIIVAFAIFLSAQAVMAEANPLLLHCKNTIIAQHPTPTRKTCAPGNVSKRYRVNQVVYPASSTIGWYKKLILPKCQVTYYPATTYPAYTTVLPPCNPNPTSPGNPGNPNPPGCGNGSCNSCLTQRPICIKYGIYKGLYNGKWVLFKTCTCYGHIECFAKQLPVNGAKDLVQVENKLLTGLTSKMAQLLLAQDKTQPLVKAALNKLKNKHKLKVINESIIEKKLLKKIQLLEKIDLSQKKPKLFAKILDKRGNESIGLESFEDNKNQPFSEEAVADNEAESTIDENVEVDEQKSDKEYVDEHQETQADETLDDATYKTFENEAESNESESSEKDSEVEDIQERAVEETENEGLEAEHIAEEESFEKRDSAPRSTNGSSKSQVGLVSVVAISMCFFATIF